MGREGQIVRELLRDFAAAHPQIDLRIEQLPWSAAREKLLTAFAGDATPDLCQLGNSWIPEFVALHALQPLDERLAASEAIDRADYFDGIWDTNVADRMVYGVPWYVDTRLLFYRRDLLAQAGFDRPATDWDGWMRQLVALKRLVGAERYSILLPLNEFEPLLALALQSSEPLLREAGRWGNFRSDGFRRALRFYLSMFERALAPAAGSQQIANVWNEFGRGFFTFYISGPWNIGEFRRRLAPAQPSNWLTAPLPGPHGPGLSIAGGASLVLFRRSQSKDAAWRVIEYLARPDVQRRFHAITGNLPPRRSTWDDPRLLHDPPTRAFYEQLARVAPAPKVPEWERIATEMRLAVERIVLAGAAVEATIADLDARTDRILEKRRWMLARAER